MPGKYTRNIVTKTREYTEQEFRMFADTVYRRPVESSVEIERLLWMDNSIVPAAAMSMECIWLWGGTTKTGLKEEPHLHDFDEVIGIIGSDPDRPGDLGSVMEMHLGDELHYLTKSCLMHIPAGMQHGPLTFKEVHRPVFFFTLAPVSHYSRTSGLKNPDAMKRMEFVPPVSDASGTRYGRYITTQPKSHAPSGEKPNPKPSGARATQIVSLDGEVSPGAFYVDCVWIWSGTMTMSPQPHKHDFEEIIGIIGSGPKNNHRRIGGDVSLDIEGEKYYLTESSLVYLPKDVVHCPLEFKTINSPVLCFTIGNTTRWDKVNVI